MKKLLTFAVIALAVITMNACKSSDAPDKVAEKFLNHIAKKEFADAKKLATPESASSIDMLESFSKMGGDQAKETTIKDVKCKEDGDKAACDYTENAEAKKIDLVKKDGKWLVEMKKESPDMNTTEPTTTDSTATKQDTTKK